MFPIKYIDNNLVWNKDNEVFAYYELIPYNYSFLSPEQKYLVHDSFRQLIAQSREGKIHALQIATESSIRSIQEQSKKLVTGKLKEVAYQKIDDQTEALVSMIGDNQVDYRFFLGFKLMVTEAWYRDNMPGYKAAFEDGTITMPKHDGLLQDHRAIKLVRGVARIPEGKTDGDSHGDRAMACVYAHAAAKLKIAPIDYMEVPGHARGFDNLAGQEQRDHDFHIPEHEGW